MKKLTRLLLTALLFSPLLASAQVYKCADSTGKIQFSDQPCATGQQSSEVRIDKHPEPPAPKQAFELRMSKEAVTHEKERARRTKQSNESHQRAEEASAKVRKLKDENHNPQKCAEARRRMAAMEKSDPLLYKIDRDYNEFKGWADLYCGN